jgi:hypothetical protein
MTPAAFEQRGFYQGVCDSYTRIRKAGRAPDPPAKSWKDGLRPFKQDFERKRLFKRGDARAVAMLMDRAYVAGVAFHQQEVRTDSALLEWVLRPDYFDYALPDGWEQRLAGEGASR